MLNLFLCQNDLRIHDNPALCEAAREGIPLSVVYLVPDNQKWPLGGASKWWLHHSLQSFQQALKDRYGLNLIICFESDLHFLLTELKPSHVFFSQRYEAHQIAADEKLKKTFKQLQIEFTQVPTYLLSEPHELLKSDGTFYKVYTPFMKASRKLKPLAAALSAPKNVVPSKKTFSKALHVDQLKLLPQGLDWDKSFYDYWEPGEKGARAKLQVFLKKALGSYADNRNRPDLMGSSRLSPHLHFGEISVRELWHAVENSPADASQKYVYHNELIWRDFAHHLLYHCPHTDERAFQDKLSKFPWKPNKKFLNAWQKGETGYPIVDAGMRELWQTGWMHNRVRMIVASFLVKHLLQPWQEGAKWFWDTLVDASLAQNSFNWQWSAGCGADAAPYFRIFNPILQGKKFDPDGVYVRRWIPELEALPDSLVHTPWESPILAKGYPAPLVDHNEARALALKALSQATK